MKKTIQLLLIFLLLFSVHQTQANNLLINRDSVSFSFTKKEQKMTEKAHKITHSRFGQWLIKRAIKKVEKKQSRFEKKIAKKQIKKGANWKPKKQRTNDVAAVIAIIFFIIGLLFGAGGLFTLPFNDVLAKNLFYISGSFFCAGGGILTT